MIKNNKTLIKPGITIAVIVCVGKILGFAKQSVIAWAFGADGTTDVYFAADSYIGMLGQIIITSLAPLVLTHYLSCKQRKGELLSNRLLRDCLLFFPAIGIFIAFISCVFSQQISEVLGISYSVSQKAELSRFIIYLSPVIILTSIIGVIQGTLEANYKFTPAKLSSLFFSISIIIAVFLFKDSIGIKSLLIGFIAGYVFLTFFLMLSVKEFIHFDKEMLFRGADFKELIVCLIPVLIGNSIVDIGHLLDKIVASSLETGSVSSLYYGQVISSDLVNAVIITTIGTILLPSLTQKVASNVSKETIKAELSKILRITSFFVIGITSLYCIEGSNLIKLVFERGNFTAMTTDRVSNIAICYALGFIYIAFREVLVKAHYAYKDTTSPMINSILGVFINLISSILFAHFLGDKGVALATSLSILVVSVLSVITISKHLEGYPIKKDDVFDILKSLICGFIAVVVGHFVSLCLFVEFFWLSMVTVSLIMIITYFTMNILLNGKTVKEIIRFFQCRTLK